MRESIYKSWCKALAAGVILLFSLCANANQAELPRKYVLIYDVFFGDYHACIYDRDGNFYRTNSYAPCDVYVEIK